MLQCFALTSILLLLSISIYPMEGLSLKELTTRRVAELIVLDSSQNSCIKAFSALPIELSVPIIHCLMAINKTKSALPIVLLSYKLHQQQQTDNKQYQLRLMLSNNQQVQLTPEQSRELIQTAATIQNLIQDLEEHVEEIPLLLLTQEQVIALLSYITITNALNTSTTLLEHEIQKIAALDSYEAKYTAIQQFKDHLATCTIPLLCDLLIAGHSFDIKNSIIAPVLHVLGNKLLQIPQYQDEYTVIDTLPNNIQHMLVQYLIDNSAVRYVLCSNSTTVIESTAQTLTGHKNIVNSVAWSPDSKYIASGSYKNIKVWDTQSGTCIYTLEGHTKRVNSVSWSPDNRYIASGSGDNTIRIWDTSTGTCIHTLIDHTDLVTSVSWSPNGTMLVSGSWDRTVKIWDAYSGICIRSLTEHLRAVDSVSWSPNSKYIAGGSWNNTIQVWDAIKGTYIQTLKNYTRKISWSPDSKCIAGGSFNSTINVWSIITGRCIRVLEDRASSINAVSWSPDGRYIASGSDDTTIKVWDATTENCIHTLKGHTKRINAVSWSPDGSILASGSDDTTIKIWEILNIKLDTYLKNTVSWEQALLLIRIINQQDIDFTHDMQAYHCYISLPEHVKRLIKPLTSKSMRRTILELLNSLQATTFCVSL